MNEKDLLLRSASDTYLSQWREKEKTALELLQIVGELRFDRSIELVFFRKDIYDVRPSAIIDYHTTGHNYIDQAIHIETSLTIAHAIAALEELPPSKIDIGKLYAEWVEESASFSDIDDFIRKKLNSAYEHQAGLEPKDVILYGFGRIGRLAARRIIASTGRGEQLRLKAIVIRAKMKDKYLEASKRAALLQQDSIHGDFQGTVEVAPDGTELLINGNRVALIYASHPSDIDYTHFGIRDALVIDNTGVWRDREALAVHLRPGVSKVLLTAPGKEIPNIVYGINHESVDLESDDILCAASCTTNAIAPVLQVMDQAFGLTKGHIETIHSYTSDQNLLDNFHKKPRRGRGAATNMVLTTTGAATAVAKVLPHLKGKLTGNAVRVPTPNVSLAIMNLDIKDTVTVEEVNAALKNAAMNGDLVEQIHYSNSTEYVSSQAVGMVTTSVVDAPSTIVSHDGKTVTVYAWYDNEYGYTCQVIRLAKHVARVRRFCYY